MIYWKIFGGGIIIGIIIVIIMMLGPNWGKPKPDPSVKTILAIPELPLKIIPKNN